MPYAVLRKHCGFVAGGVTPPRGSTPAAIYRLALRGAYLDSCMFISRTVWTIFPTFALGRSLLMPPLPQRFPFTAHLLRTFPLAVPPAHATALLPLPSLPPHTTLHAAAADACGASCLLRPTTLLPVKALAFAMY
jgi:hypothetical protein